MRDSRSSWQRWSSVLPITAAFVGAAVVAVACSSTTDRSGFEAVSPDSGAETAPPFQEIPTPCTGLACKVAKCDKTGFDVGDVNPTGGAEGDDCAAGGDCQSGVCETGPGTCADRSAISTTITGKVYDPAGANALYNVLVYIPGGGNGDTTLAPFTDGVSCDQCSAVAVNPLVATLTNTKGEFTLPDVPVDKDVPIVIQVGKWRRSFTFDVTKSCKQNKVPDHTFTLPKNGTEGDMPQIAVTAGGYDALECLLRGIGIDESEFVAGAGGAGHVHVFNGAGGAFKDSMGNPGPPAGGDATNPFGGELWNDVEKLKPYDITLLSCEGDEHNENKAGPAGTPGARQALWDYANLGGRIFGTHYHYTWFKNSPQPDWQAIANWGSSSSSTPSYDVDTSFPKGASLADWLVNVNASSTSGTIQLTGVTGALTSVNPPAQSWIAKGANAVRYFSFNAPIGADSDAQCGRVVYGDLHLMTAGGGEFPGACPAPGGLAAQQKALEFMFFDLSNCVQADDTPPNVPK